MDKILWVSYEFKPAMCYPVFFLPQTLILCSKCAPNNTLNRLYTECHRMVDKDKMYPQHCTLPSTDKAQEWPFPAVVTIGIKSEFKLIASSGGELCHVVLPRPSCPEYSDHFSLKLLNLRDAQTVLILPPTRTLSMPREAWTVPNTRYGIDQLNLIVCRAYCNKHVQRHFSDHYEVFPACWCCHVRKGTLNQKP